MCIILKGDYLILNKRLYGFDLQGNIQVMLTAVSLFTGCGGSDAGLIKAGFQILMANDTLPYAKEVYEANFPETDYKLGDISKIETFPKADLLAGCYPCQGFSQGGVREPLRNINYLYREFDRALRKIRPKVFIVENVSGMNRSNFNHLLWNQIIRFRFAGYKVKWSILNARDFGVAQSRKRIFIVGVRSNIEDEYEFPEPTHGPDEKKPYKTLTGIIGDMPSWPEGEFCNQDFHWYYLSRNRYCGWKEQSKTIVSNMRHMPLHPRSSRLVKVGEDAWEFSNKRRPRRFSYKEAARIQGFNKTFKLPDTVSMAMKYSVIGNAVPPQLFKAVAKVIPDIW